MRQLYVCQVRPLLSRLSADIGRQAEFDDIPDRFFEHLADAGFSWVYLLGAWTYQEAVPRTETNRALRDYLAAAIPGFTAIDLLPHVRAPISYRVPDRYGGEPALARIRQRLNSFGMSLMLDFVANHTGVGHRWVKEHPDWFLSAGDRPPHHHAASCQGDGRAIAYGRDPHFPPWTDTLQLDHAHADCQKALVQEATVIASRCDAIKCQVAMLQIPSVFARTWGRTIQPFWDRCIATVREEQPATLFLAEVYWNLEFDLHRSGFDFTYDKVLYDRLVSGTSATIREHLRASVDYQNHCVRFLENPYEQRAAAVFPDADRYRAALFIAGMVPGMFLCHQGQEEGRGLYCPPESAKWPAESGSPRHQQAVADLFGLITDPVRQRGNWCLLEPVADNSSLIACIWCKPGIGRLLCVINWSSSPCASMLKATSMLGRGSLREAYLSHREIVVRAHVDGRIQADMPRWGVAAYRMYDEREYRS